MEYGYQQQQQQQEGQFGEENNAGPFEGEEGVELEDHPHLHHHHPGGQQQTQYEGEEDDYYEELQGGQDGHRLPTEDFDRKAIPSARDASASSAAGKLFVGGLSWETSEDTFANYFGKFGEITDSVIMTDRHTGRPRGFGFVTFSDVAVADRVLEQDHVIDGRTVEVKRTVPREDSGGPGGKGVKRTKKIFIGGIPPTFTEDELKEYFSFYGGIVDHQIMLDHKTGRSRGFGFVTFESEEAVEQIFSEDKTHELGGKRVEIKKAEPKRPGGDYGNSSKAQTGYNAGGAGGYSAGNMSGSRYDGKMGNEYGGGGGGGYGGGYGAYGGYNSYGGAYPGSAGGFYGGYGGGAGSGGYGGGAGSGGYGYGFGFGGPMMYGGVGGAYGGGNYTAGAYGRGAAGYGGAGKGYDRMDSGNFGGTKGYPNSGAMGGGGYAGGGKSYGGNANGGAPNTGRFHPYRK